MTLTPVDNAPRIIQAMRENPLVFARVFWPEVRFYQKQVEIIESVRDSYVTVVPAGNQLGKDYTSGFISIWFFLTNPEVRIVTTSVKDDHLRVLWGEIGRFIEDARKDTPLGPLKAKEGGPLLINHRDIRKLKGNGTEDKISYLRGMVSERGEGMAGHHAAATLGIIDEACHDDQTEVLTDSGWKLFEDLNGSEKFLTMDPETRNTSYLPATARQRYWREGIMHLYERRCGNFCVTPNHRMLWRKRMHHRLNPWTGYYLEPIDGIRGDGRAIPRCFNWTGVSPKTYTIPSLYGKRKEFPDNVVPMRIWVEFLGWFLSEGSFVYRNGTPVGICVSQSDLDSLRKITRLVKSLGYSPCVYDNCPSPYLRVSNLALAAHLRDLAGARYCTETGVPKFVKELSPELIEVFLTAYRDGDGYLKDNRDIIYTSSKRMADDLQLLSYKAGREATIRKRNLVGLPAPNGTSRYDGYVVSRSPVGQDSHLKVKTKYLQKVDYKGYVYCVTVPPHHTLFTRRKGECMWSGNSGVDDITFTQMETWAKRILVIGNPNPCQNFFYRMVKEGDILAPE